MEKKQTNKKKEKLPGTEKVSKAEFKSSVISVIQPLQFFTEQNQLEA